jgi:signal peptidase I
MKVKVSGFPLNTGLLIYIGFIFLLSVVLQLFAFQTYLVSSNSMKNTLFDGDKMFVNKLNISDIRRDDVLILKKFNTTYVKRCVGLPGETISIKDGRLFVDSKPVSSAGTIIPDDALLQREERNFSPLPGNNSFSSGPSSGDYDILIYERYNNFWTKTDFGPFAIPRKGEKILLTDESLRTYEDIFKLENSPADFKTMSRFGDEGIPQIYTFKQDYFFVLGDNRLHSRDSRMFGCVSRADIIGKATYILFSKHDFLNWERILKRIE